MTIKLKRFFDITASMVLLAVLAPLMLAIALTILCESRGGIIFRQRRPGLNEQMFNMLKFRTMSFTYDTLGRVFPDHMRLTRLGHVLRASSMDELPQLWNVLKGDMSLVGPRPLLPEYLSRYNTQQRRRHEVKPGITGWAQINGRNALTWEEKFGLDVWYVDHWSLWLDASILWITVRKVISCEGISQQGHATMPEFMGRPTKSRQDG